MEVYPWGDENAENGQVSVTIAGTPESDAIRFIASFSIVQNDDYIEYFTRRSAWTELQGSFQGGSEKIYCHKS